MIASQPGSPIGFKDMKLLVRIDNQPGGVSGKIYNAGTKPMVGVYQQQVTDVAVQLGPKAAKMIIQVFEADTNDQIESTAIELRRPEDPNAYVSLSCIPSEGTRKCEIPVPPLPTNIKVSKSGYDEQDVTGQLGPRTDVATLNPGETKNLSIRLRRKKVQP